MSETTLRYRCPCGRLFADEFEARRHADERHAHRTCANDVRPVRVRVDESSATTLDSFGVDAGEADSC